MKQTYFTPDTIKRKSTAFLSRIEDMLPIRRLSFAPERSALLILDMQKYFLQPDSHAWVPSASAIMPGIVRLRNAFSRSRLPVVLTQHVNNTRDAGMMATWWRETITSDHPLCGIVHELLDPPMVQIVQKTRYDAFYLTCLEETLQKAHIEQVVICGVLTHLCCETTARSAFMRGFEVFFCVDGTATYNETFHMASLLNLAHGFASLVLVDEIMADLEGSYAN